MKAIEMAKKLYPELSKDDIKIKTCPDLLQIIDKGLCLPDNKYVDGICEECWSQEVSDERVKWLIEAKAMCKLVGCD